MPPKTIYDKDDIIEAAFNIAKEEGFKGITARSVAKYLGCSVAPIYVNFETIEDLTEAVIKRVFDLSQHLFAREDGDNVFDNIGKASLAFAREYPVLFRELIMQPNPYMDSYETLENVLLEAIADEEEMRDWTVEEKRRLLLKMRIFQTGLSVLGANGHLPKWADDEELLMEIGEELLLIHKMNREEKTQ